MSRSRSEQGVGVHMDSLKAKYRNPSKKREGLLGWIKTQLTPEQLKALDTMDVDFVDTLVTFAEHKPDGVNWVVRCFWLMYDQSKSL